MARFVLLDHSIKRIGGHHLEYAVRVLESAEERGFEPILAVNKRFFERARIPAHWTVLPCFTDTTYEGKKLRARRLAAEIALDSVRQSANANVWTRCLDLLRRPLREKNRRTTVQRDAEFIDRFCAETAALYRTLNLIPGDHVFITTQHESEIFSLAEFFSQTPEAARIDLSMQFHHPLFEGRTQWIVGAETRHDDVMRAVARITEIPGYRVHGFCTNRRAAEQYSRLGAIGFQELAAPVDPAFFEPRPPRDPSAPLNVVMLGKVRAEKGTQHLAGLIESMSDEFLVAKRCRLVLQSHRMGVITKKLRRSAERVETPGEVAACHAPVVVVKWPLSSADYLQMVRATDVGLLPYDSTEYFARISGVMVELRSAGIPLIVSAGGWMADQLSEPNWAYAERLIAELPALAVIPDTEWRWQDDATAPAAQVVAGKPRLYREADPEHLISPDQPRRTATIAIPARTSHTALQWRWRGDRRDVVYMKIEIRAFDAKGKALGRWVETTGRRAPDEQGADRTQASVIPVPRGTTKLEATFSDAFGTADVAAQDLRAVCLDAFAAAVGCPLGAVGLIMADTTMLEPLLKEMLAHYDHYRATAERHFETIRDECSTDTVISQLLAESVPSVRIAG